MKMKEYYEAVQKGFSLLIEPMAGYIGMTLNKVLGDHWWDEVRFQLADQRDLPDNGTYAELVDSLDIANCIRIIDRAWNDIFKDRLSRNCRTWAKELMGIRNAVSHIGLSDIDQHYAERALDTMALLCSEIDSEAADSIREIYKNVRSKATENDTREDIGIKQPQVSSLSANIKEKSLLKYVDTELVQRTNLTRKVTYGGKTVVYPVYRIRLDVLFYNDQNDRISTWISKYESENGKDFLNDINIEIYNRVIEDFIVDSNPEAIQKTQNNISLIGQREPGVTLADGRIVDGNRRFTCLRRLQRHTSEPLYFETVIMEMDIQADRKQIKLLELAIQHGEEKKVDYDLIDYAIGTYRDIVLTGLLTVEEYAASTNEAVADVRKRLDVAEVLHEFLNYIGLPQQYHIAREYQVYSLFQEMMPVLKLLGESEKKRLKEIVFNNVIMKAILDQRKFIRDIKSLVKDNCYSEYFAEQGGLITEIEALYSKVTIKNKQDIDRFADDNELIRRKLQYAIENALQKYRNKKLRTRPSEYVSKCVTMLLDIDPRLFDTMDPEEKESFKNGLSEIEHLTSNYRRYL